MTKQEIIKKLKAYPGKKVKVAISDIDGILRGKVINVDKFLSLLDGGFGFCDVVFGWDCADVCYDNSKFTGWHTGYPDALAQIDLNTFREVPWDNNIPFFLGDFEGLEICPRQLLKKINKKSLDMGFSPMFAQEYEWFNFAETSENLHDTNFNNPKPLTKGMFGYSILRSSQNKEYFNDLFDLCGKFKIPIEGIHTETGPGVYEVAILYTDILESADRSLLFKTAAKEIGHKHGVIPTFMAKISPELPGCSGHLHQSLWNKSKSKNLFYDAKDKNNMSETMKHYLAGILELLPDILPFFAPTINSYKRLVEGMWAPTTVTWGIDNRTTTIRCLPGSEKATRMELRVVGSDVNPYLAMSASLAAGLYGIEKKLKLKIKPTVGNGYEDKSNGVLPTNLWEATQNMKNSKIVNKIFGKEFIQHFSATREWEWRQHQIAVTDWEKKRYFEVI